MIPHKYIVSGIVTRDIAVEMNIVLDINFVSPPYSPESINAVFAIGMRNSINNTLNNSVSPRNSLNTGYNNIGRKNCLMRTNT